MFFLGGGLLLILTIALCVHVVRTNQSFFWLYIIILIQPIGAIVYLVAIVLPEMFGGTAARRVGKMARETLDPTRTYRDAKTRYDDTPTVANGMRLAEAALKLGRYEEAEGLYREAAQGIHADDPTLLMGRANALVELGRYGEALAVLEQLGKDEAQARSPQAALARARAYEGLGRLGEANTDYEWASERLPGLEAISRYAAFLARTGRKADAEDLLVEIDRRIARADPTFRKEARTWRALAAEAIG